MRLSYRILTVISSTYLMTNAAFPQSLRQLQEGYRHPCPLPVQRKADRRHRP